MVPTRWFVLLCVNNIVAKVQGLIQRIIDAQGPWEHWNSCFFAITAENETLEVFQRKKDVMVMTISLLVIFGFWKKNS